MKKKKKQKKFAGKQAFKVKINLILVSVWIKCWTLMWYAIVLNMLTNLNWLCHWTEYNRIKCKRFVMTNWGKKMLKVK